MIWDCLISWWILPPRSALSLVAENLCKSPIVSIMGAAATRQDQQIPVMALKAASVPTHWELCQNTLIIYNKESWIAEWARLTHTTTRSLRVSRFDLDGSKNDITNLLRFSRRRVQLCKILRYEEITVYDQGILSKYKWQQKPKWQQISIERIWEDLLLWVCEFSVTYSGVKTGL